MTSCKLVAVKRIRGRKIAIRRFEQPADVKDCHILYVSRAVDSDTQKATIQQLSDRNILFVARPRSFSSKAA